MPFDQKRINGPESSVSYRQYVKPEKGAIEQAPLKRVVVHDNFRKFQMIMFMDAFAESSL